MEVLIYRWISTLLGGAVAVMQGSWIKVPIEYVRDELLAHPSCAPPRTAPADDRPAEGWAPNNRTRCPTYTPDPNRRADRPQFPRHIISRVSTFGFRPHPTQTLLQMAGIFGGPAAQRTLTDFPDVDLVSPPPESISTIAFSPVADHLAVASWGPDVSFLNSRRAGPVRGPPRLLYFFWVVGTVVIVGSDIRRRLSRSITGEGACTTSWDGTGLVLDEGENSCPPKVLCVGTSSGTRVHA